MTPNPTPKACCKKCGEILVCKCEVAEPTDFQGMIRLSADLKRSARLLTQQQARYLVDSYYQQQDQRIRAGGRLRAASTGGEPHEIMEWDLKNMKRREDDLKLALGEFAKTYRVGQWLQSICGIGPVISAGLLAYIDIRKAKTAGHVWRFAGLDPTLVWLGTEKAKKLVAEVMGRETKMTVEHLAEVAKRANRHPENIRRLMEKPTKGELSKVLARRPWSESLKTLAVFKAGESFVKVQNNANDFYGHIFRKKKDAELIANENYEFKDQAEAALAAKNYGRTTEAYKAYIEGRLPPAQIHARARRYAAKLFLSHLHQVMFEDYYQAEAPKPYCFEKLHEDHRHFVPPPNWPGEFGGKPLREMFGET